MPPNLLPVPHYRQSQSGFCLPAAARMILEFLEHPFSEAELAQRLGTKSFGTPAPNLYRPFPFGHVFAFQGAPLGGQVG